MYVNVYVWGLTSHNVHEALPAHLRAGRCDYKGLQHPTGIAAGPYLWICDHISNPMIHPTYVGNHPQWGKHPFAKLSPGASGRIGDVRCS
jgi:hypothetical protein